MKNAIRNLIDKLACHHDWKVLDRYTEVLVWRGKQYENDVTVFTCKKCGKIKKM